MAKIKVTIDGETYEVEKDALGLPDGYSLNTPSNPADGYITKSKADAEKSDAIEEAVQDRLKNHVSKEKAAKDDDVIQAVLEEHGEEPVDLDAKKQQWRQEWEEEELNPTKETLESDRERMKRLAILNSAKAAGVDSDWTDKPKHRRVFLEDVMDRLEYDPEHGDEFGLVGLDSEGNRISGGVDKAYGGVGELMSSLADEEPFQEYFADPDPQGGGRGHGGGGGGAKDPSQMSADERAKDLESKVTY